MRSDLAWTPGLPQDLVRALAADPDVEVRTAVATTQHLPADVRRALARDPDWDVSEAIEARFGADPGRT